jgi:uncharacterized protein YkwD
MKTLLTFISALVLSQWSLSQPMMVTISDGSEITIDEFIESIASLNEQVESFSVDSFNLYFEKHLNAYRLAKKLEAVTYDRSILKVVLDQSDYCMKKGCLDHRQPSDDKRWASDRCVYYAIESVMEYENLHSCDMRASVLNENLRGVNYYDALSRAVLRAWQLSPGHNRTLLSPGEQFAVGNSRGEGHTLYSCFVLISK